MKNFGFLSLFAGNSASKAPQKRQFSRVCRFEELEGREMLSVTPWGMIDGFELPTDALPVAEYQYQFLSEAAGNVVSISPLGDDSGMTPQEERAWMKEVEKAQKKIDKQEKVIAKAEKNIEKQEKKIDKQLDALERKMDKEEDKNKPSEKRLDQLERKMEKLEEKLENLSSSKLDKHIAKLDWLEQARVRIEESGPAAKAMAKEMAKIIAQKGKIFALEAKLEKLEDKENPSEKAVDKLNENIDQQRAKLEWLEDAADKVAACDFALKATLMAKAMAKVVAQQGTIYALEKKIAKAEENEKTSDNTLDRLYDKLERQHDRLERLEDAAEAIGSADTIG